MYDIHNLSILDYVYKLRSIMTAIGQELFCRIAFAVALKDQVYTTLLLRTA